MWQKAISAVSGGGGTEPTLTLSESHVLTTKTTYNYTIDATKDYILIVSRHADGSSSLNESIYTIYKGVFDTVYSGSTGAPVTLSGTTLSIDKQSSSNTDMMLFELS